MVVVVLLKSQRQRRLIVVGFAATPQLLLQKHIEATSQPSRRLRSFN
ncbi:hypothetical protein [Dictyobacter kobayashii]|nr:hypothetical protein [Dictyobacter kobayashii]